MDFFEPPAGRERWERFAPGADWAAVFAAAAGEMASEPLAEHLASGGERRAVYKVGPAAARERLWLQCDAAHLPALAGHVTYTMLMALAGAEPSRHRQLALARAQFAVATPSAGALAGDSAMLGQRRAPLFDAGALGASEGVLAAMDRFAPTLVVHLQDWGAPDGDGELAAMGSVPVADGRLGASGLRQVESFYLEPELHRRLAGGARRRWGRPTPAARALATHPDTRLGRQVRRYVARMGVALFDAGDDALRDADGTAVAALRLAPGRYAVREEWRRLGGASLCELALARYGASGLCAQALGSGRDERAAALLAAAEGAVLYHLGLESAEATR